MTNDAYFYRNRFSKYRYFMEQMRFLKKHTCRNQFITNAFEAVKENFPLIEKNKRTRSNTSH